MQNCSILLAVHQDILYIVMEFADGGTLHSMISQAHGPLPEAVIWRLFVQVRRSSACLLFEKYSLMLFLRCSFRGATTNDVQQAHALSCCKSSSLQQMMTCVEYCRSCVVCITCTRGGFCTETSRGVLPTTKSQISNAHELCASEVLPA